MATQEIGRHQKVEPDPVQRRAVRIMRGTRTSTEKIFDSLEGAVDVVNCLRSMGCVIVLTMGTWDLYHEGHGNYIELAKQMAHERYPDAEKVIQVIGVDSDALTRERKGPRRPVVKEDERCRILRHHESIDMIVLEHELGHLHRHLPHDVRVISTTTSDLEADEETTRYCEHLVNLPPQAETSTSARVRLLILEGNQEAVKQFREGVDELLKRMEEKIDV